MADNINFTNEPKGLGPKEPKKRAAKTPPPATSTPPPPPLAKSAPAPGGDPLAEAPAPAAAPEKPNFFAAWFSRMPLFIAIPLLPIGAIIYGVRELAKRDDGAPSSKVGAIVSLSLGVLVLLGIAGGVGYEILRPDKSKSADAVVAGDCVTDESLVKEGISEVNNVRVISCDKEHYGQAYYTGVLPSGVYPGEDAVVTSVDDECYAQADLVLLEAADPDIFLLTFFPTSELWADGDRSFTCLIVTDGETLLTGSRLAP